MRVIFFGSPPFADAIFARVLDSPHAPVALVTQPERSAGRGRRPRPSSLVQAAQQRGLPVLRPRSARSADFKHMLRELQPDVLLVASYGELLDEELLQIPSRVPLNVHASLLPRWRGASPIQAAIMAGDEVTGVSVQRMVRALDAGDVLLALQTEIAPDETAGGLAARLSRLGAEAAAEALALVAAGRDRYRAQDPAQVTHCRKLSKEQGWIDWRNSTVAIGRHVRAMQPWPGARAERAGGPTFEVLELTPLDDQDVGVASAPPGSVHPQALERGRMWVATADGWGSIDRLKPEGRAALATAEFLRGARWSAGTSLIPMAGDRP